MTITVFIRYQLDPYKRGGFEAYARNWLKIISKCGGEVVGYWMPHEGTDNIAYGLISFENLAATRLIAHGRNPTAKVPPTSRWRKRSALFCPRNARSCGK